MSCNSSESLFSIRKLTLWRMMLCRAAVLASLPLFEIKRIYVLEVMKMSFVFLSSYCQTKFALALEFTWNLSWTGSIYLTLWIYNVYSPLRKKKEKKKRSPFIMFSYPHCFISLKTSLRTKWYLSVVIDKGCRQFSRMPEWKISKHFSVFKEDITFDLPPHFHPSPSHRHDVCLRSAAWWVLEFKC